MSLINERTERTERSTADKPWLVRRYAPSAVLVASPPWAVLAWRGEIDAATAPACRRAADDGLGTGARSVVLDLGQVSFIDSSGLAVVGLLLRSCRERDGELIIAEPSPTVRTTLRITGFYGAARVLGRDELPVEVADLLSAAA